jgi:hypothetical protein
LTLLFQPDCSLVQIQTLFHQRIALSPTKGVCSSTSIWPFKRRLNQLDLISNGRFPKLSSHSALKGLLVLFRVPGSRTMCLYAAPIWHMPGFGISVPEKGQQSWSVWWKMIQFKEKYKPFPIHNTWQTHLVRNCVCSSWRLDLEKSRWTSVPWRVSKALPTMSLASSNLEADSIENGTQYVIPASPPLQIIWVLDLKDSHFSKGFVEDPRNFTYEHYVFL